MQRFLKSKTPMVTCNYSFEAQRDKLFEEVGELAVEVTKKDIDLPSLLSEFFDVQQSLQALLYVESKKYFEEDFRRLHWIQNLFVFHGGIHEMKMQERVKKYDGLKLVDE